MTFKKSRGAYLALIYYEKIGTELSFYIRLASMYDQPDKPDNISTISVLPNELLIKIFQNVNYIHDQVALLATCERFCKIINEIYLNELKEVNYSGRCAFVGLSTACNILKYGEAKGYKFSFQTKEMESSKLFYLKCTSISIILNECWQLIQIH